MFNKHWAESVMHLVATFSLMLICPGLLANTPLEPNVSLRLSPLPPLREGQRGFLIEVENRSEQSIEGKVKVEWLNQLPEVQLEPSEDFFADIRPGGSASLPFSFKGLWPEDALANVKASAVVLGGTGSEASATLGFYRCLRTSAQIVLDGDLGEWNRSRGVAISSPGEFTSRIFTCWDDSNFYIAAEIIDSTDSDPDRREWTFKKMDLAAVFDSSPGLDLAGFPAALQPRSDLGPEGNLKGYVIEQSIPFESLHFAPRSGAGIGFNVRLKDRSWTGQAETFGHLFFEDPKARGAVSIENGQTRVDGEPFFPFGFWTFGQSEEGFRRLEETGANTIGCTFPWNLLEPEKDRFDERQMDRSLAFLDLAHRHGLKVLVQLEIHPEPEWLFTYYSAMHMTVSDGTQAASGFMRASINHPGLRNELSQFLKYLLPRIEDHPSVLAYSLWNEPSWTGDLDYSVHTRRAFRKWATLKARKQVTGQIGEVRDLAGVFRFQEVMQAMGQPEEGPSEPPAPEKIGEDRKAWLNWMRFRQETFAEFFQWYRDEVRALDPRHPITIKQIWQPLDSRFAWASATNYEKFAPLVDIAGSDPYPHPFDNFIQPWIADWTRSAAPDKPRWYLEFNRAFVKEMGQISPEELRCWLWQGIAHGASGALLFYWPMQPFDPNAFDNAYALLQCDTLEPMPAAVEAATLAAVLKRLAPELAGAKPAASQVAILHDWNTLFQMPGDPYPGANATTLAQMLYRSHIPVDYLSEEQVKQGALGRYKVLGVAGTVASDEETLNKIAEFRSSGGSVIACARFGERDELFQEREVSPPAWMGVRVLERNTAPRKSLPPATVEYRAQWNDGRSVSRSASREYRGATGAGGGLGAGGLFGFEDLGLETETIEKIEVASGTILAKFPGGAPAAVRGERTLYIAKDLSYSNDAWRKRVRDFVLEQGVEKPVSIIGKDGEDIPSMDAAILESPRAKYLLLVNSPRLYDYDGNPISAQVRLNVTPRPGGLFDLIEERPVPLTVLPNGEPVFETVFHAGEVRVFRLKD